MIYGWEWAHRFLGKAIGLFFALPFFLFWAAGRLRGRFWPVLCLFALGAAQGGVGWWMVVSGLEGRLDVSPVRLAIHLGLAFLVLALSLSLALSALGWPRAVSLLGAPRALFWLFAAALFVQILLGALMAGADAGKAFADWPTIGGEWLPSAYGAADPIGNSATLQFNHRIAGYTVTVIALALACAGLWRGKGPARTAAVSTGLLAI
jgi:cytochrome c oxidase assembly protein subunit 15